MSKKNLMGLLILVATLAFVGGIMLVNAFPQRFFAADVRELLTVEEIEKATEGFYETREAAVKEGGERGYLRSKILAFRGAENAYNEMSGQFTGNLTRQFRQKKLEYQAKYVEAIVKYLKSSPAQYADDRLVPLSTSAEYAHELEVNDIANKGRYKSVLADAAFEFLRKEIAGAVPVSDFKISGTYKRYLLVRIIDVLSLTEEYLIGLGFTSEEAEELIEEDSYSFLH